MPGGVPDTANTMNPGPGTARIAPSWRSWDGAQGGYVAALALGAMREDLVRRAGEAAPVRTLGAHFLAPVDERPLRFTARTLREGRRTPMCTLTARQGGAQVPAGSAVFGWGGAGPALADPPAAPAPAPEACPPLTLPSDLAAFAAHLEIRPASGARPLGGGPLAELLAWLRFTDRRPLDAGTLVVLADALPPGLFAVWTVPRPVPTAELTVHFTDALDAAPVEDRVLVRIRTEYAGGGWTVEDSALWSTTGRLLALARQARVLRNGSRAAHGGG
ncbi:thioesterase family protein [Streptomyces sp. NPDC003554]